MLLVPVANAPGTQLTRYTYTLSLRIMDKEPIVDDFEDVASPAAANEAVKPIKSEQEDDGIVIATPSESWVLLDSKSDDEEVTLDEASTTSRRQPGLIAAAAVCALVVAAAAAKVRADGIDTQFELATGLDGSLASAAAVRLEALAKLSARRCVEIKFQGAPDAFHTGGAPRRPG